MSNSQQPDESDLKRLFAAALLRNPGKPFEAGIEVFGANTGMALRAASEWLHDPIVLEEKAKLTEEDGEMAFLPSKAELARKVYDMATNEEKHIDFKDRLAALQFYAALRNFIEKPKDGAGSGNTTNVQNNVLVVRDHGTDDQWSNKLREQQRMLIANAEKPNSLNGHSTH